MAYRNMDSNLFAISDYESGFAMFKITDKGIIYEKNVSELECMRERESGGGVGGWLAPEIVVNNSNTR